MCDKNHLLYFSFSFSTRKKKQPIYLYMMMSRTSTTHLRMKENKADFCFDIKNNRDDLLHYDYSLLCWIKNDHDDDGKIAGIRSDWRHSVLFSVDFRGGFSFHFVLIWERKNGNNSSKNIGSLTLMHRMETNTHIESRFIWYKMCNARTN